MKQLFLLLFSALLLVACLPVPAAEIDESNQVAYYIDSEIDLPVIPEILQTSLDYKCIPDVYESLEYCAENRGEITADNVIICRAGFSFKDIDTNILIYVLCTALGLIVGATTMKAISAVSGKIAGVSEAAAATGYQTATMLNNINLVSAGTLVKEGSEVVDELGDVATTLANVTADGKFSVDDAKKVLKEGKDVVVAMKDFLIVVKPKKAE